MTEKQRRRRLRRAIDTIAKKHGHALSARRRGFMVGIFRGPVTLLPFFKTEAALQAWSDGWLEGQAARDVIEAKGMWV